MVDFNEVQHTFSDLRAGKQTHDLTNFIQDLQQQRAQHPEETQQYLAACNGVLMRSNILPGLQIEGLTQKGDRVAFKMPNGTEMTAGADSIQRLLQPGELGNPGTDPTARTTDTTPKAGDTSLRPGTAGDAGTNGHNPPGHGADTSYTVKQGDSLWRIARRHLGQDASEGDVFKYVKDIARANGMNKFTDTIRPNQKLTLPGDGTQTAPQTQGDATTPPPQTRPADTTTPPQNRPADTTTPPSPSDSTPPPQPTPGDTPPPQTTPGDSTPAPGATTPGPLDQTPQVPVTRDYGSDSTSDAQTQMAALARKEAIKVLNEHMNDIFNLAATWPIDGKFPVGQIAQILSGPLGRSLDPQTLSILQNVESIEKHGNHVEITQKSDMRFPLKVDEHGAVIDDIKVDHKLSFDLSRDASGRNQLANVKGISVEGHTNAFRPTNRTFDAPLENVTIGKDSTGHTTFDARFKNPENWYEKLGEKVFRGVDRGNHIDASIQLSDNGSVTITDPTSGARRRIA